jgi:hypothetical protein
MPNIVINRVHGGFGLSDVAQRRYTELTGREFDTYDVARDDPNLLRVVLELGEASYGRFAHLEIVFVPDDVDWFIDEYDGREWVAEKHRTWPAQNTGFQTRQY